MKRFFCVLLCLALVLPSLCVAEGNTSSLEEQVRAALKKKKTSGAQVIAAKDGEIVFQLNYGWADKQNKIKVSDDTYFKIASCSKLVTGVVTMTQVERGLLDLDTDIGQYLGGFKAASPYYSKTPLTLRHLMTHTAGFSTKGGWAKNAPLTQILDVSKKSTGSFMKGEKPGTAYRYSNYGAGTAGALVEAVTGRRLSDVAGEYVFGPLGIDAAYAPSLLSSPENITSIYKTNGSVKKTRSYFLNKETYDERVRPEYDYIEGYGSLWIHGADLCRIGMMLANYGELDGVRILQEDTVKEMFSGQQGKGGITVDSPYGLFVERVTNLVDGKMLYGHQGLVEGVLCNLYFDPETRFVFVLVTNGCNSAKTDRIGTLSRVLFNLLWEEYTE